MPQFNSHLLFCNTAPHSNAFPFTSFLNSNRSRNKFLSELVHQICKLFKINSCVRRVTILKRMAQSNDSTEHYATSQATPTTPTTQAPPTTSTPHVQYVSEKTLVPLKINSPPSGKNIKLLLLWQQPLFWKQKTTSMTTSWDDVIIILAKDKSLHTTVLLINLLLHFVITHCHSLPKKWLVL